jgi:hypothetical protein
LIGSLLMLAGGEASTQGSGIDLSPVILGEAELPKGRELFPAILHAAIAPDSSGQHRSTSARVSVGSRTTRRRTRS